MKKEKLLNIPNAITTSRVVITLFIIVSSIVNPNLMNIVIAFIIGMLTDFFDGFIARRHETTTEFGRRFDMIADRFLMIATVIVTIIILAEMQKINHIQQILMILAREIIATPFLAYTFVTQKTTLPHARLIGKVTTFMQGVTFPMIILSLYYQLFAISSYFAILTGVIGLVSGFFYIKDTMVTS